MGIRRNSGNQPAESLRTQYVSGNYFSMFGIGAYAGRMFTQADDRQGLLKAAGDVLSLLRLPANDEPELELRDHQPTFQI